LTAAGSDEESEESEDGEATEEVGELEDMAFEETLRWVADREVRAALRALHDTHAHTGLWSRKQKQERTNSDHFPVCL